METQKIDLLNFWYHWNWLKFKDNNWKWHHFKCSFISNTINQQATFHITGWYVSIHAHTHIHWFNLFCLLKRISFLTAEKFLQQTEKQLMKMQCNTNEMHLHIHEALWSSHVCEYLVYVLTFTLIHTVCLFGYIWIRVSYHINSVVAKQNIWLECGETDWRRCTHTHVCVCGVHVCVHAVFCFIVCAQHGNCTVRTTLAVHYVFNDCNHLWGSPCISFARSFVRSVLVLFNFNVHLRTHQMQCNTQAMVLRSWLSLSGIKYCVFFFNTIFSAFADVQLFFSFRCESILYWVPHESFRCPYGTL